MPNVSLSAFLRIFSLGTPQKSREYAKYLTPGGYDFYWRLKDAAAALTMGGQVFDQCVQPINEIKNDVERKHNFENLKSLQTWLGGKSGTFFDPPKGACTSVKGFLTVKLEPEFGFVEGDKRRLIYLWSNKGMELKPISAGVGIYLMQKHLSVGAYSDCSAAFLDLRRQKLFVSDLLPPRIPAMVNSEFAFADSFFEEHAKAA